LLLFGVVLLLAFSPTAVQATEPSIEIFLQPTTFGVEDLAQLTVRINEPPSDLGQPRLEELENLEIVQGPSTGSEFSFINGVATRAQTFTYIVRALAPGSASIGSVVVTAGTLEFRADPVVVEVVEGSVLPPRGRVRRSPFITDPFSDFRPRRAPPPVEVVLRHALSAREVAVGEPVVATVYLDSTTSSLYDFSLRTAPSYPGFWAQRLDNPEQAVPELVEVDGTVFNRYRVLRTVLVPLKAGRLEIPPVEAAIGVRSRGFFDSGQLIERSTAVRFVEVSERPPAPPGFAGAVGDLRYTARVEPDAIEFGSSTVLTVRLEGMGNLPLVEAPALFPGCDDCDTYPPEESSEITIDDAGIRGSRSWQVTVVPRSWGDISLGAVDLAVFDPASGRYRTQTIGPLPLKVSAPTPTPTPVITPIPSDEPERVEDGLEVARDTSGLSLGLLIGGTLLTGLLIGGLLTWFVTRRSKIGVPPRRRDQTPADRARVLQLTLERWWLGVRTSERGAALEGEMQELRRDLEAVRFAPGRADHTDTVVDLESRLRGLMRRA
jgi:hypothetical protein